MITPEQFQEIGETLLPLLDALTEWIARDMIERFMIRFGRGEKKLLTGTDEWQAWVLEQAGGNLDEIQKALAKSTGKSQQEIAKIFKGSGIQAAKADAEAAAVMFSGLSPGMMAIIMDAYERTVGEISNITRTTAGATNQAFIDICDAAYWKVRTGAQSYTAAMLDGVKALGQLQPTVRYPSGHKDTLEVAVLRCIRTGVAQSSGNMTIQQCKDMGWNHVLVSQHLGARVSDTDPIADHAGWQGRCTASTARTRSLITCWMRPATRRTRWACAAITAAILLRRSCRASVRITTSLSTPKPTAAHMNCRRRSVRWNAASGRRSASVRRCTQP